MEGWPVSAVTRKMQIRSLTHVNVVMVHIAEIRSHLRRWRQWKRQTKTHVGKYVERLELTHYWWECKMAPLPV